MPIYTKIKNGFPLEFLTFGRNEMSIILESNGGIDCFQLLDYETFGTKTYYERGRMHVFSRTAGSSMGRTLYGPGVRFLSQVDGRAYILRPLNGSHLPYGVRATQQEDGLDASYSMRIGDHALAFEFGCKNDLREEFMVMVSKLHFADQKIPSAKNQYACTNGEWGIHWLPAKYREPDFDPKLPFPDDFKMQLKWDRFYFKDHALIFSGTLIFRYGSHPLYIVMKSDAPLELREKKEQWNLVTPWNENGKVRFAIAYGRSEAEAFRYAEDAITLYAEREAADDRENQAFQALAPECKIEDLPVAEHFINIVPLHQNALLLGENEKEAAIRASSHKFGYFALWDHIYPIRDFLMAGRFDVAKKLIAYLLDYPHIRTALWSTLQMIITMNEYQAYHRDPEFLKQAWDTFKDWFDFACTLTESDTGLVKFSLSMGCDNPAELGGSELFTASDINGWWYNTCRIMENFGYEMDDPAIAVRAAVIAAKIEKHFLEKFYDPDAGYLTAIPLGEQNIFHNSATEAIEYPYSRKLLRNVIKPIADYQAKQLYHPLGHLAISWDGNVNCEMWRYVRMNQHVGHECKVARYAGDATEAKRVINGYLDYYKRTLNAVETFNYFGCDANVHELADWQAFSATAAQHGIFQGVCGLFWHQGGLCYTPAKDSGKIAIKRFHIKDAVFDIEINGSGAYTSAIELNGTVLEGTMQIPAELIRKENTLKITRSDIPFTRPVLLYALDLEINHVRSEAKTLSFTACKTIHTDIQFCVSGPVQKLTCDGNELEFEYNAADHTVLFSDVIPSGSIIELVTE